MAALTSQLSELPVADTGIFKLFIGVEFVAVFLSNVMNYLDSRSLLSFIETSFIKHVTVKYQDEKLKKYCAVFIRKEKHKRLGQLNEKYKREYPKGTAFVVACQWEKIEDVKLFIAYDSKVVNQLGKDSYGNRKIWRKSFTGKD